MDALTLFEEMDKHLLEDTKPSEYLNAWRQSTPPPEFRILKRLIGTEQTPLHHPEGDVWNHTMLVVDNAAKVKAFSRDARAFLWAALLHDIGKPATTRRKGKKITSYGHDIEGARQASRFLAAVSPNEDWNKQVTALVRYHMHILFVVKLLPFADMDSMKRETSIEEVALLGACDRFGRTGLHKDKRAEERANIEQFLRLCGGDAHAVDVIWERL